MAEFPKETHGLTRPQEELGDKVIEPRSPQQNAVTPRDSRLSNTKVTNQQVIVKEVI